MFISSIMDFFKFTHSPVDSVKVLMTDFRKKSCLGSPSRMIKELLAYCIIGKSLFDSMGIGNLNRPRSLPLFTSVWRKLASSTNNSGDRVSPFLTPLKQLKVLLSVPFRRTAEVAEEKIISIQFSHFCSKPFFPSWLSALLGVPFYQMPFQNPVLKWQAPSLNDDTCASILVTKLGNLG